MVDEGIEGCSLRTTATTRTESASLNSSKVKLLATAGAFEARVTSISRIFPSAKSMRLMIEPTSTASSTNEVMSAGVETATSTPQLVLKSHSLRELLMRAITRGTPNSCLASQLMTRLSSDRNDLV